MDPSGPVEWPGYSLRRQCAIAHTCFSSSGANKGQWQECCRTLARSVEVHRGWDQVFVESNDSLGWSQTRCDVIGFVGFKRGGIQALGWDHT